MELFDFLFIGSKLTNLIAIKEILDLDKNKKIALFSPSNMIGGHFSSLKINGITYDPGTVLHEFTSFNNLINNDIYEYNPKIRNNAGIYYSSVEKYIRKYIKLNEIIKPKMLYKNKLYDDIIFSNSYQTFNKLPIKNLINKELSLILKNNKNVLHPKDKHLKDIYKSISYKEASLNNHGKTLHYEIFEPFFEKMTNRSTDKLLALYSRVAWLPLYYPETIYDLVNNKIVNIDSTRFHYPSQGFIGALANNIYSKSIQLGLNHFTAKIDYKKTMYKLNEGIIIFENGDSIKGNKVIYSETLDKLIDKSSIKDKSFFKLDAWSVKLLFTTIEKEAIKILFSCIYFPEKCSLPYRIRYQPNLENECKDKAKFIIELNSDYILSKGYENTQKIINEVLITLVDNNIIKSGYKLTLENELTLNNCISLPNIKNISKLQRQMDIASKIFPKLEFPSLNGFFADTLNDQILKGLKLGRTNMPGFNTNGY